MLAHVLLSSNSPLRDFLKKAETTLTEVIFTQRDREEERGWQNRQDHRAKRKGKEDKRRENKGTGEIEITYYVFKRKNIEQRIGKTDFKAQLQY